MKMNVSLFKNCENCYTQYRYPRSEPDYCTKCGPRNTSWGDPYWICPNCGTYHSIEDETCHTCYKNNPNLSEPKKKSKGKRFLIVFAIFFAIGLIGGGGFEGGIIIGILLGLVSLIF